jgi:outer membrane protein OmpA-like peptidoglycan-associated protein
MFPYVHYDGSLYFSSTGHMGFGGLDLFKTKYTGDNWETPENLMSPINSSYDDFGIAFMDGDTTGLISSNRPGGMGSDDIYAFSMIPQEDPEPEPEPVLAVGRVITTDMIPIEEATVFVMNNITEEVLILKSDEKGMYEYVVDTLVDYTIIAKKTNYIKDCLSYFYVNEDSNPNDLVLTKLETDLVFKIENIYYDLDKWYIRDDAKPELDKIVELMEEHPIKIELSSHTDCRASNAYNANLSQKRAESAVNYIISQGIDHERITAMGYGESRLVNRCADGIDCSEEQHQMNRRTEFRILEVEQKEEIVSTDQLGRYMHGEIYLKDQLDSGYFSDCEVTVLK